MENVDAAAAADVTFVAQLPDNAFISNFTMSFVLSGSSPLSKAVIWRLRGAELLVAEVKEKAAAQADFDAARARGETTGLVKQKCPSSARPPSSVLAHAAVQAAGDEHLRDDGEHQAGREGPLQPYLPGSPQPGNDQSSPSFCSLPNGHRSLQVHGLYKHSVNLVNTTVCLLLICSSISFIMNIG